MKTARDFLINDNIKNINYVRLIEENREKRNEILTLSEAKNRAKISGMDLVLINTNASPPIVKIVSDFSKFKYELEKSNKKQKSNAIITKELIIKSNINKHDLDRNIKRIQEWLDINNRVKLTFLFKGRETLFSETKYRELIDYVYSNIKNYRILSENRVKNNFYCVILIHDNKKRGDNNVNNE